MNQREIKFRAWDKEKKEWIKLTTKGSLCIDGYGQLIKPNNGGETFDGDYELLQFTGLTDKNGKEIFEGDIIDWESRNDLKKGISEIVYRYLIVFEEGAFIGRGDIRIGSKIKLDGDFLESFEIIGNIYENPELLTPKI